jgi:hypothetical protein
VADSGCVVVRVSVSSSLSDMVARDGDRESVPSSVTVPLTGSVTVPVPDGSLLVKEGDSDDVGSPDCVGDFVSTYVGERDGDVDRDSVPSSESVRVSDPREGVSAAVLVLGLEIVTVMVSVIVSVCDSLRVSSSVGDCDFELVRSSDGVSVKEGLPVTRAVRVRGRDRVSVNVCSVAESVPDAVSSSVGDGEAVLAKGVLLRDTVPSSLSDMLGLGVSPENVAVPSSDNVCDWFPPSFSPVSVSRIDTVYEVDGV